MQTLKWLLKKIFRGLIGIVAIMIMLVTVAVGLLIIVVPAELAKMIQWPFLVIGLAVITSGLGMFYTVCSWLDRTKG